jgi:uncharacterized protein (TIGR04255 family)
MPVPDFIYPKPPLVEVIADLKWALAPSGLMPGAGIDPQWQSFQKKFVDWGSGKGFTNFETLVPDAVPRELLAYQPIQRARKTPGGWPLFQLGPGILTVNQVPPYDGWASFTRIVDEACEFLSSRPLDPGLAPGLKLELRYIDGFGAHHGMQKEGEFIRKHIKLCADVAPGVLALAGGELERIVGTGTVQVAVEELLGRGVVEIATGSMNGQPAVIMNIFARTDDFAIDRGQPTKGWFDAAHRVVSTLFNSMLSEELMTSFGEPIKIGEQ